MIGMNNYKKIQAFTLVESMVVLAISAIMLSVALPSMTTFIDSKRNPSKSFILEDLPLAKTTARSNLESIQIIPLASKSGGNTDWSKGWSIHKIKADNSIGEALQTQGSIEEYFFASSDEFHKDPSSRLTFDQNGFASKTGSITFWSKECQGNEATRIKVLASGLFFTEHQQPCPAGDE